jgi:hypothetical protein
MQIEIHDAALEARMRRQIQAIGASTPEELCSTFSKLRRNRTAGFWRTRKR